MRVQWTAEARSDLIRLHEFLAPVNREAANRVVQLLRAAPTRLRDQPRLGPLLTEFVPREVRRVIIGDYELRYEIRAGGILVLNLWHTREDR
jgi:plasmid stabilization system protein ParE